MLYLDGKAGIFASFRESWTRTKGHFYTLLGALGIVLLLAACECCDTAAGHGHHPAHRDSLPLHPLPLPAGDPAG